MRADAEIHTRDYVMATFGIVETPNQTLVINPSQLRMIIPQVEGGKPVCYLIFDDENHIKVDGTLDGILGKLDIRSVLLSSGLIVKAPKRSKVIRKPA